VVVEVGVSESTESIRSHRQLYLNHLHACAEAAPAWDEGLLLLQARCLERFECVEISSRVSKLYQ
jgi:hypothetical protein